MKDEICTLLLSLRASGVCMSLPVARHVISSVLEERVPALLESNGGPSKVSESWVRRWLYTKLKWVHRRFTADSQHLPPDYKTKIRDMNYRIAVHVLAFRIPKALCYSADESFQELVCAATDTFEKEGSKRVKGAGNEDKQGITLMVTLKADGSIACMMVIYGGTTQRSTPGHKPLGRKALAGWTPLPARVEADAAGHVLTATDTHWMQLHTMQSWDTDDQITRCYASSPFVARPERAAARPRCPA